MTDNIITVNNVNLSVKEYKGKRVVTFKDIDECHGRPSGTARKRFNANRKHFIEGEDYFKVKCGEVSPFFGQTLPNRFNPNADIILATRSGYLMLVKSFHDDLAWDVQRMLVDNYFRVTPEEDLSMYSSELRMAQTILNDLKKVELENRIQAKKTCGCRDKGGQNGRFCSGDKIRSSSNYRRLATER